VHDAAHSDITGKSVVPGSYVHDTATVGDQVGTFVISGDVTYSFYENGDCSGTPKSTQDVALNADGTVPDSSAQKIDVSGNYAYQATYLDDSNYNASKPGDCEPFSVIQFGKTMGFWSNTNGQKTIDPSGNGSGYAAHDVDIGRGAVIDTKAESLKVLPTQLNACGKGNPLIFGTANADCTLAGEKTKTTNTLLNKGSLNTLAAQTLALGYNIELLTGYSGQSIGLLGCTGTGTVNTAFADAVALINGSVAGGSTTQAQIGAMNQLLSCLNHEA
jgi:hypothetical protein